MPPVISEFDCHEDEGENSVADLVDVANRKDPAVGRNYIDDEARSVVETTSGRSPKDISIETTPSSVASEMNTTEKEDSSSDATSIDLPPPSPPNMATTPTKVVPSSIASPYDKRFVPRLTPSFMEPEKVKATVSSKVDDGGADHERKFPADASRGNSGTTHLAVLSRQLEHLASQIYRLNDGNEFNVNSPRQVARVLFGEVDIGDTGTGKDALEAMASAGNEMA